MPALLPLLRVAPLLGAMFSMTFVFCEAFFIRPLTAASKTDLRQFANRLLPIQLPLAMGRLGYRRDHVGFEHCHCLGELGSTTHS